MSLAVDDDEVVGVAAMSFFRTALDGAVTRLAIPVNVATDPATAGKGLLDARARRPPPRPAPAHGHVPERRLLSIFVHRSGGRPAAPTTGAPAARRCRHPVRARTAGEQAAWPDGAERMLRGLEVRPLERFGPDFDEAWPPRRGRPGRSATPSTSGWRYLDSPRDYRCFGAYRGAELRGVAVVGHTFKHGVSAGFLADPRDVAGRSDVVRALLARAIDE